MSRTQDLFNIITRQQVYVEGLKEGQQRATEALFEGMLKEIRVALAGLEVANVGDLTQKQVAVFLRRLREIQTEYYSAMLSRLIGFIVEWLSYERDETPLVLGEEGDDLLPPLADIWKDISKEPMGATGTAILPFLAGLKVSAITDTANRVRAGVADNMAIDEFRASIVGTRALNFRDGILKRHRNGMSNGVATVMQQAINHLRLMAYDLFAENYMWNSVIDGQTTDVCRHRNGRVYIRGSGPVPPAHIGCRSSVIPIILREPITLPASYYRWISDQPEDFVADILPARMALALRTGKGRADDLPRLSDPAPLTLAQYKSKTNLIKTGTDG